MRQWLQISTKGQVDLWSFIQFRSFRITSNLNIFISETHGLIQLQFHMEYTIAETILIWLQVKVT